MKKTLSTLGLIALAVLAAWLNNERPAPTATDKAVKPSQQARTSQSSPVASAFAERRSNLVLTDSGRVIKVLSDDLKGSRHQRFLVQTVDGPSILIAHNIDLAPRVRGLREGDQVRFKGEYEWTEKGGVVHWTHHDPAGRHPGGWIELDGERFE
ncbi:MAG: DUF3465 domain-containing protein [Pseudomonadales bacterium]